MPTEFEEGESLAGNGGSSARRSNSPVMTRNDGGGARSGVGRSPSARRAATSVGQATTGTTA
ncbi:hypothetical protein TIFTF001_006124 [Ficus carica]|uniref:Uncharacterized protein n=1 Tax=Ficus carica TaxID=3494 RepID=A0AA88CYE4_FICCA|nr:hypothetical protein TIFTF001_006124 [Ficus carica]